MCSPPESTLFDLLHYWGHFEGSSDTFVPHSILASQPPSTLPTPSSFSHSAEWRSCLLLLLQHSIICSRSDSCCTQYTLRSFLVVVVVSHRTPDKDLHLNSKVCILNYPRVEVKRLKVFKRRFFPCIFHLTRLL